MKKVLQFPLVCPVSLDDRTTAIDLVFSHLQDEERNRQIDAILSAFENNEITKDGLLGAYRKGVLAGAIFSQLMPGKNAQVWLPRLVENEDPNTAVVLLQAAAQWLDNCQVRMAQMLLESVTAEQEQVINQAGFDYLTDLLYLVCPESDFPNVPLPAALDFEHYNSQNHERLARIVDATYQASLDCPKLNHVRKPQDVLEGYRATGEFAADRWLIVRNENRDVGCLLLADHPHFGNMELVYMGIIPAARGNRWGTEVARHAQWIAKKAGRQRLVLAVDAANRPAIAIYASVGFQAWDQRRVYYRIFPHG